MKMTEVMNMVYVLNGQTQYTIMMSEYNEIYGRYMFMHYSTVQHRTQLESKGKGAEGCMKGTYVAP